jgi:hypothetical protein
MTSLYDFILKTNHHLHLVFYFMNYFDFKRTNLKFTIYLILSRTVVVIVNLISWRQTGMVYFQFYEHQINFINHC